MRSNRGEFNILSFLEEEEDIQSWAEIKEIFMQDRIIPVLIPGTSEVAFLKFSSTVATNKIENLLEDTFEKYDVIEKILLPWERGNSFEVYNYDNLIETKNTTIEELIEYSKSKSNLTEEEFCEKYGEDIEIKKDNGDGTFNKVYRKQTMREILEPELSRYRTKTYEKRITYKVKKLFNKINDLEVFASSTYSYLFEKHKSFQLGSSYVKSESYTNYDYNPKEDNIPFEEKVNYIKSFINSLDYEIILSEDVNELDDFWYYRLYQVQSRNALLKLAGHYTSILKDEELGMLFESIDLNELLNKSEHSYILTESKREKGKVKSKK